MDPFSAQLEELEYNACRRRIPSDFQDKTNIIDFSSNDYLGLGNCWKDFTDEFYRQFADCGFSSSASRLLSSKQNIFSRLEDYLGDLYSKSVILFNSGYHANVGIIGALSRLPSTLFVCDKIIHASSIDGLKIANAEFARFPHNDMTALNRLLERKQSDYRHIVLLTESIFSMEGDIAPLKEIVSLKERIPNLMICLDEAHAFGVRGQKGLGLAEEYDLIDKIDFIVGTFGKAAASVGAFVAASSEARDFFINFARPFIFSTALPPVNIAWSFMMINKLVGMNKDREYLKDLSEKFRKMTEEVTGKPNSSRSQIVPLVTGNAAKALEICRRLEKEFGIHALPIRRPTVPPGKECIRFSLNAAMSFDTINRVREAIRTIQKEW